MLLSGIKNNITARILMGIYFGLWDVILRETKPTEVPSLKNKEKLAKITNEVICNFSAK